MPGKKKRFRYFVDKPFQTKFILRFVVLILISAVISFGFFVYIDSQKFSKGVLFEEITKDFYRTTDIGFILDGMKKVLSKSKADSKIISKVDEYSAMIKKFDSNVIKASEIKKELLSKDLNSSFSGGIVSLAYELANGKSEETVNKVNKAVLSLRRAVQECSFEDMNVSLATLEEVFKETKYQDKFNSFKERLNLYANLVTSTYDFLKAKPGFVDELRNIINDPKSGIEAETLDSLNRSLAKIQSILSSVNSYSDVLVYETRTYEKKAYNLLDLYWKPIVALSILQILLITIFGLFFSHSIAGPVHRIKKELREIAEGKLPITHEIRLRKSDFLLDIAKEINNTLKSIAERYNIR
jgi:hypothetical protein